MKVIRVDLRGGKGTLHEHSFEEEAEEKKEKIELQEDRLQKEEEIKFPTIGTHHKVAILNRRLLD